MSLSVSSGQLPSQMFYWIGHIALHSQGSTVFPGRAAFANFVWPHLWKFAKTWNLLWIRGSLCNTVLLQETYHVQHIYLHPLFLFFFMLPSLSEHTVHYDSLLLLQFSLQLCRNQHWSVDNIPPTQATKCLVHDSRHSSTPSVCVVLGPYMGEYILWHCSVISQT